MNKLTKWDIFFIVLSTLFTVFMIFVLIFPLTQELNPFKLMSSSSSDYNFIDVEVTKETNVLESILNNKSPNLYEINLNQKDQYVYKGYDMSSTMSAPIYKIFNDYTLYLEGYNKPAKKGDSIEIFGSFGFRFKINDYQLEESYNQIYQNAVENNPDALFAPYHVEDYFGVDKYISAIDLIGSTIVLEKYNGTNYNTVIKISGETWKTIYEKNNGVVLIKNEDGSLLLDSGIYKLSFYLKQVTIDDVNGGNSSVITRSPKIFSVTLNCNMHDCSNGILFAENQNQNIDFQLNVINDENVFCYFKQSQINVGDTLEFGVSLTNEQYANLLKAMKHNLKLSVYRLNPLLNEYTLIEERDVIEVGEVMKNKKIVFDNEELKTGQYKIVLSYNNSFDKVELEYEYYFVFEG